MSGQIATVEAATETSTETSTQASAKAGAGPGPRDGRGTEARAAPGQPTIQDVLVEDVSIDGMCGVY